MPVEIIIICLRFAQYAGGMVLFGSSLFLLYGKLVPRMGQPSDLAWTRKPLVVSAILLVVGAPLQFITQTADLAGSWGTALESETLVTALFQMNFGKSSFVRLVLALAALVVILWSRPGRASWLFTSFLGASICASFAWMGHGAATEGAAGWVHLAADIFHSLAAGAWIGALVVFWIVLRKSPAAATPNNLAHSLAAFSGAGTFLVVLILGTGLVNGAFTAGRSLTHVAATLYGQVLLVKLALFFFMLVLAASNRFRHAPALLRNPGGDLSALKTSLGEEAGLGFLVLAAVSWLGTLPPVTAQ